MGTRKTSGRWLREVQFGLLKARELTPYLPERMDRRFDAAIVIAKYYVEQAQIVLEDRTTELRRANTA